MYIRNANSTADRNSGRPQPLTGRRRPGEARYVDPIVRGLAAAAAFSVVVVAEANCIIVVDRVQGGRYWVSPSIRASQRRPPTDAVSLLPRARLSRLRFVSLATCTH